MNIINFFIAIKKLKKYEYICAILKRTFVCP
jgi:hypothetical protein